MEASTDIIVSLFALLFCKINKVNKESARRTSCCSGFSFNCSQLLLISSTLTLPDHRHQHKDDLPAGIYSLLDELTIHVQSDPVISPRMTSATAKPLAVLVQPACTSHKWIRTAETPYLAENPERIRAVLVGVAVAIANLEQEHSEGKGETEGNEVKVKEEKSAAGQRETTPDISLMLGGLSLETSKDSQRSSPGRPSDFLYLPDVSHPAGIADPTKRGKTLLTHPALQYVHSETPEAPFPPVINGSMGGTPLPDSTHLRSLLRWCLEAPDKVKQGKIEIPLASDGTEEGERLGFIESDLYLGPGSIDAIEGSVSRDQPIHLSMIMIAVKQVLTVSQAVDLVCRAASNNSEEKPMQGTDDSGSDAHVNKAFCVIRPPGHHCGQDAPSG